ncbi:hypothetical protein Lspi_1066 [Legionella spiritensis]|uniref:Uncharacterized protein n=1 Tax=Legionella spiritensis TaxID=452 RepID=A0A0W0Z613_LEGSP|nr:hypothetical protein Lspi_1066 [Legionella spiritensis]SNV47077.1 Uncharacterised protein [Legionella spiritensis]
MVCMKKLTCLINCAFKGLSKINWHHLFLLASFFNSGNINTVLILIAIILHMNLRIKIEISKLANDRKKGGSLIKILLNMFIKERSQ